MRRRPLAEREIVLQRSVPRRTMCGLAYEPNLQPITLVASNRKSYCVVSPVLRQSLATRRVTQIAELVHFLIAWFRAFVAGCTALAAPSAAQRQSRRMQPAAIFQFARRHKKWAGHWLKPLLRDEGIVLTQQMNRQCLKGPAFSELIRLCSNLVTQMFWLKAES
jgi:hypothetical protein